MTQRDFDALEYLRKYERRELNVWDLRDYATPPPRQVPALDDGGGLIYRPSIYLDNAATLPLLKPVGHFAELLEQKFRSNVGRSYGYKERVLRFALWQTRAEALKYFNAPKGCAVVLDSNITRLILVLLKHIDKQHPDGYFLLSPMSHSASSIPIHNFSKSRWGYLEIDSCCNYDIGSLTGQLERLSEDGRDITIAIETVSNVTGYETNWKAVLRKAEEFGVRVLLDNAQGACIVEIDLSAYDAEIYVGVSGHKMGARDGSAALVGPQRIFELEKPLEPTGGMIFSYTEDREFYMAFPTTVEPGTPNYIAASSLAESFRLLSRVGLRAIKEAVGATTSYLESRLKEIERVKVLGCDAHAHRRYGPVSFVAYAENGQEIPSSAIAACLSFFHGIQVRANHHCVPVLLNKLKGIPNADANAISDLGMRHLGCAFEAGEFSVTRHMRAPADPFSALHVVRPSVSFGTTESMIDTFADALREVLAKRQYRHLEFVHAFGFSEFIPSARWASAEAIQAVIYPNVDMRFLLA